MLTWEKAYLINMNQSKDRLLYSSVELDKWNIEFERFPAIKMKNGKEGCRQSHIAVYKKALEENVTPLIIEDDIIIRKEFKDVSKYLDDLDDHTYGTQWDIFYFYRDCRRQKTVDGYQFILSGPTIATHFYMVNWTSLEKIIEIAENKKHTLDWNLLYAARGYKIKSFCASTNLVCQDIELKSSIAPGGYWKKGLGGILKKRNSCI